MTSQGWTSASYSEAYVSFREANIVKISNITLLVRVRVKEDCFEVSRDKADLRKEVVRSVHVATTKWPNASFLNIWHEWQY